MTRLPLQPQKTRQTLTCGEQGAAQRRATLNAPESGKGVGGQGTAGPVKMRGWERDWWAGERWACGDAESGKGVGGQGDDVGRLKMLMREIDFCDNLKTRDGRGQAVSSVPCLCTCALVLELPILYGILHLVVEQREVRSEQLPCLINPANRADDDRQRNPSSSAPSD